MRDRYTEKKIEKMAGRDRFQKDVGRHLQRSGTTYGIDAQGTFQSTADGTCTNATGSQSGGVCRKYSKCKAKPPVIYWSHGTPSE